MSHELINRSSDLKRLRDEGFFVQIKGAYLLLRELPYVNANRQVRMGTLISTLSLAGNVTQRPDTHVVWFDGECPCGSDGERLEKIVFDSGKFDLGSGVTAKHRFSSKPERGYLDYHHMMKTYAAILSGPAAILNPEIDARRFRRPDAEDDSVFNYVDTASSRSGIGALSEQLMSERIAIIGLGGTGSYILDLVAKTPVREIRLFDDDEFLQHNAFRTPGAPSLEELRDAPKKVDYLRAIYSRMHRRIFAHNALINQSNVDRLEQVTFAFICIDPSPEKRSIIDKLEALDLSFIDVGMGLELNDGSLGGILRVTTSTADKRDHVHEGHISFSGGVEEDLYSANIQVADLNALNAAMAVVKWKKIRGFYRDLEHEHHCTYTTDGNTMDNSDLI